MMFTDQENYSAAVPLSSFVILLVIILTCISRRRKVDAFTAVEQSLENDIKEEYLILCFPCLKKKPRLEEFEQTTDLREQFEYVVEKYTIRKVPLLLANTTEDILERQNELKTTETEQPHPRLEKNNFVNFQVSQEVYDVPKMPSVITVAANTTCPARKIIKERPKPADILESMSPICRPNARNPNYVVIPTKGSLKQRDIMMTKREITNQYLNNFSSVFVDNLKDQVPKDPERFPSLSRPYTSALRNYPIAETHCMVKTHCKRKYPRRPKSQKIVYAFPSEEPTKEEESTKEEIICDSDAESKDDIADALDSEFQEDNENETNLTDKSKSFVLSNESDSGKEESDYLPSPFITTLKSTESDMEENPNDFTPETDVPNNSLYICHRDEWANSKSITYEDIQALDVGYEFTSSEKLGVKPKMTRIHYPHESDRLKESLKHLALGDCKASKKCSSSQEQASGSVSSKSTKTIWKPKQLEGSLPQCVIKSTCLERSLSRNIVTETSFLPKSDEYSSPENTRKNEEASTTTFTSRSVESKTKFFNDITLDDSTNTNDTVAEISKLYELAIPITHSTTECSNYDQDDVRGLEEISSRFPIVSKSRSFHDAKKENPYDGKGKHYLPYPVQTLKKNAGSSLDEQETETSCSLYSRDSKTSSAVTSPRSSDPDEGKRATLRWKIVIKHHRDEDPNKKNVNVNIRN